MKIGLCNVATGKYGRFIVPLWRSANELFVRGHELGLVLFTERPIWKELAETVAGFRAGCTASLVPVPFEPWPGPTLHRYHYLLSARKLLEQFDAVYYCDADMRWIAPVGEEVLGGLVAVLHPGFAGRPRREFTYERRPESRACVLAHEGRHYFAGGFQGGQTEHFLTAVERMRDAIDEDQRRGIVALWHDESHWNRCLIDHPPPVILPPAYCCPESWNMPGRKILALDKDHARLRCSSTMPS